jgi:hypothetical protein
VKDLNELNIEALLGETFTMTTITTEKKVPDGTSHITYNLIPKAVLSLKVRLLLVSYLYNSSPKRYVEYLDLLTY